MMAAAGGRMAGDSEFLLRWCQKELVQKFGLEVNEELIQYILSMESAEEIEEYVADLLQGTDGKKQLFTSELLKRWKQCRESPTPGQGQLYRKKDDVSDFSKTSDQLKKSKRKGRNKQEPLPISEQQPPAEEVKTPMDLVKAQEASSSSKKKTKYLSLYTKEGEDRLAVILPGRHPCECLGQTHKLINNCLGCGRIVCVQEGSGPCMFCGMLVCTKEEQEILVHDSNKSQKLRKKLMGTAGSDVSVNPDTFERDLLPHQEVVLKAGLEKAIKHKDKLLEYDKTSARRTQVIDDESDYFAADTNQWLSKQEREALRKKEEELRELRHASRRTKKITIDFAGRQIFEEEGSLDQYYSRLDDLVEEMKSGTQSNTSSGKWDKQSRQQQHLSELVNPNIFQSPPVWVEVTGTGSQRRGNDSHMESRGNAVGSERSRLRIQDRELLEISDDGMCLSMHQPWASLLVRGIKKVEGRTWYTSHRGRLWIAAAAKRPSPQEVTAVEATYRTMYGRDIEFPKDYPTGCLLGCVDLIDCVSQEQYHEQFADQESGSPFVFICTNPQELLVKFPLKGRHKIWKLDSKIHQGMKKALLRQKQIT
ncbi:activating signal cointegrator 1 [Mobula birostris]|uniref:activating signal cointegrator 1 n=1 Tax=Mobula birostris TaxID=1983395 RepID=UPI003B27EB1D